LVLTASSPVLAEEPPPELSVAAQPELSTVLPKVTVVGRAEDPATGESTLTRETLERLPTGNGSISEAMRVLPGVQLSDAARLSARGGEILPPLFSIAGARPFDNTVQVDGISIDSKLDPLADNPMKLDDVPGHPLQILLNTRLVEELKVIDHNVPARFGSFTGGVVDITLRDPAPTFGGNLHFRTTRDNWTEFHVADGQETAFSDSTTHAQQPEFDKYDGGVELDLPLNPDTAVLASFQRVESRIPLAFLGDEHSQKRRIDNLFVKGVGTPSGADRLALTLLATPSEGDYFIENTRDSDFTVSTSGYIVGAAYEAPLSIGWLEIDAAWRSSENDRDAPTHWRNWKATPSKNWGTLAGLSYNREGGFGDIEKTQESTQLKGHVDFAAADTGPVRHRANAGFDYEYITGRFERPQRTFSYAVGTVSSVVDCGEDSFACVDGEQFLSTRQVYEAADKTVRMNRVALYAEDRIGLGRVELRPGLRLDYEDYMNNTDLAPRLAASWDTFGDGRSVLFAGANRYYGQTLLTDALREAIPPVRTETRVLGTDNRPTAWQFKSLIKIANRRSDLDTPYSDELTAGLRQRLLGGELILDYIHRDFRDEVAREKTVAADGFTYFTLNNNGRSRHESYRAAWERRWGRQALWVNLAYQETTTNADSYDTLLDEVAREQLVWFDGKLLRREELPRTDFNRKWVGNLVYFCRLPYGFDFSNVTQYRSGFRALSFTGKNYTLPDGEKVPLYTEVDFPQAWTFDWELSWHADLPREQRLTLALEVYNVFDRKIHVGGDVNRYETGRQFWAGAEYRF
jgi:hypothetical protein